MFSYNDTRHRFTPKMEQSLAKRKTVKEARPMFKRKRDNYTRKQLRQRVVNYLQNEFAGSSTHGLPYTVNQNIHWCERFTWALCFCASIVLVVYLLAVQYARFIEAPTVMSVENDYFNWNVSYPAFTLCPMLKIDKEALGIVLNETNAKKRRNLESYLWTIVSANLVYIEQLDLDVPPDILSLIDPNDYASMAASLFLKFNPDSITTNTNWPITVEEVMTEIGMCHVVNSNIAAFDNPLKWSDSATTYVKKNIELSVHDRDFFTQIMNYADIYEVYIHNPDETVISTMSSYTHSLKGFMSFGVQVFNSKISDELRAASVRLRKCRLVNEPISERFPIYSYNRCMLECRIQMIQKICGCIPHFYKPLKNERICKLNELKCIVEYKKEIVTLSTSNKLMKKFQHTKGIPNSSRECGCVSLCESSIYQKDFEDYIAQNFNRLRIGISNFPKVRIVREIIFSGYEILLKIGGSINLCVGSSIISMVEFCVTFIKIPIYFLVQKLEAVLKH